MNVYVPRSFERIEEAEEKARIERQSLYLNGILVAGILLMIFGVTLQLETRLKCQGLSHFDRVQFDRLFNSIN